MGTTLYSDRRGNFGLITGLLMVPVAVAGGVSLDVTNAVGVKTNLQSVADAAALSVISTNSAGYRQAMAMTGDGSVTIGETAATAYFRAAVANAKNFTIRSVSTTVTRKGDQLTSTLTYSADVPTSLLNVIGRDRITVSGVASATFQTATFRDFYLLLDNTPSMGVAATNAEINRMMDVTGCAFACHDLNNPNNNYTKAKALGIQTRINVVALATAKLMDIAKADRRVANQYRMAIFTFGEKAEAQGLFQVAGLTTDLDTAKTAASKIDLMTIPKKDYNQDQQTDFALMLNGLTTKIGLPGTGYSSASPEKVIFFVSDGVNDSAKPVGCAKPLWGSTRCMQPIDPALYKTLKDRGYKMAVLYTTYLPLIYDGFYKQWISPFQPEIRQKMEACASPGLFFEVSPSDGIVDAMGALFRKIAAAPRITG